MSKVVDWQKRAETMEHWARFFSTRDNEDTIDEILRNTERDEPDAAPVQAFEAGQWVRNIHNGTPYCVATCIGARLELKGSHHSYDQKHFARIPTPPTDDWMRANAPGWRLTGRVEDCSKVVEMPFVACQQSGDPLELRHTLRCVGACFDGYRWTVERIPEHAEVRAELASIRARLDEIAAKVGA